jgi:hypothetical protein
MTMRRRGFLGLLGGGLLGIAPGRRRVPPAASTQAIPTLFHAHPDGATTLVRFVAAGWDVPAGRLRVREGRTGRLLGTAGMVRRGDELVGELWLPLTGPLTIYSDLETPSRRGMQRTLHRLTPTPRWIIHYLVLAAPDAMAARAARVPPLLRGTDATRLVPAGVRINAWHPFHAEGIPDHLDLLRLAVPAARAGRMSGVPVGRVALVAADAEDPPLVLALRGAQVEAIITPADVTDAATLGLTDGRAEASRRIEPWLLARQEVPTHPAALVVSTDAAVALNARSTIDDWNAAYAYPRLQVGDEDGVVAFLTRGATLSTPAPEVTPPVPLVTGPTTPGPDPDTLFLPLARRLAPDAPTLDGIARRFAFPVAGTLVFNPSPFSRTDVVRDADGAFRVVTDVAALGYAFVPETAGIMPESAPSGTAIASAHARVQVERDGGAITSVRNGATERELVASGTVINQFEHAVLADMHVDTIPGVGHRIRARRMTPDGTLVSTATVFDTLPWVEIENQFTELPTDRVVQSRFPFASRFSHLRWERAGGLTEADTPVRRFGTLRWAALEGRDGTLLLGMAGITAGSLTDDGLLVLEGGPRQVLRLQWRGGLLLPDDPWRFGFGMLPLVGRATAGTGGAALPTFGRMVDVQDPMIAVVGIKPADDGVGVIVYLMDVGDAARSVPIQPGLLPFHAAVLTDLAERDLQPIAVGTDGAIAVPIERSGYAAVRLLNTEAD